MNRLSQRSSRLTHWGAAFSLAIGLMLAWSVSAAEGETSSAHTTDSTAGSIGRVVLFGGPHSHPGERSKHPTESGRDGLRDTLQAIGAESVDVVAIEQRSLTAEDLGDADLLVIYHNRRKSNPQVREVLGDWIEGGRPTVVVHCGVGAYSDWPEFRDWLGRYWVWADEDGKPHPKSLHPITSCTLSVVSGSGFAADIDGKTLPVDEVFTRLAPASPTEDWVIAETPEGHVTQIAWGSKTMPNVAAWVAGHNRLIWDEPAMHAGLREVIRQVQP